MLTVYKYPLPWSEGKIMLPLNAKILHVGMQVEDDDPDEPAKNIAYLWALVDPDQPEVPRLIRVVHTAEPLPDEAIHWQHLGILFLEVRVLHVFEAPPVDDALPV